MLLRLQKKKIEKILINEVIKSFNKNIMYVFIIFDISNYLKNKHIKVKKEKKEKNK